MHMPYNIPVVNEFTSHIYPQIDNYVSLNKIYEYINGMCFIMALCMLCACIYFINLRTCYFLHCCLFAFYLLFIVST